MYSQLLLLPLNATVDPASERENKGSFGGNRKSLRLRTDASVPRANPSQSELTAFWDAAAENARSPMKDRTEKQSTEQVSKKPRRQYPQQWHEYNLAQTREKLHFQHLLHELCSEIEQPQQKRGRPRALLSDLIYVAVSRVYAGLSSRRFASDSRTALEDGFLEDQTHYNTPTRYMRSSAMTPYLKELVTLSALPLKAIETDFAVDSSGFSTCRYARWFSAKYGNPVERQDWKKAHVMIGVRTQVVVSVEVSGRTAHDSPYFHGLVTGAKKRGFQLNDVSADKAYSSANNLFTAMNNGATPYIPFKSNSVEREHTSLWNRMLNYYRFQQDEFKAHYHKRSNVESAFSMMKAKFGERLYAKTDEAQVNEVLCKILAHNICCVIASIYELNLEPTFGLS